MTRVVVIGAGALGSVYGGYLALAGHDVQLLAREAHARAIDGQGGLRLRAFGTERLAPLRAVWEPGQVEPAQIALLATKAPDTEAALASLEMEVETAFSVQNGVDEHGLLAAWAGADRVVGAVSMVGATLAEPGVADHTLRGPTFLGGPKLAGLLEGAGLEVIVTDRIRSVEWSKLVHASPSMALSALTRRRFHEVFLAPELAGLFSDLVVEGVAVARASGVEVDDWPQILPVRTLADLPRAEAVARIAAHGRDLEARGMTEIRISMLQSVERERRTEVEAIHGTLARAAARTGVPAPVTTLCYRLLAGMDRYFA